jgi:large subunit ribosomal protein L5
MQRLKIFYLKEVVPSLIQTFGYNNVNKIPKLKKIIINRGFDESCDNNKILGVLLSEMNNISGQRAVITKAKKAISSFKVKQSMPVGMFLTLRNDKMYSFLDRLINLSLPRIRDFQGITKSNFDNSGNFSFGISDQLMFPEIIFDKVIKVKGMNITFVTNCKTDKESFFLLKSLGFPFN